VRVFFDSSAFAKRYLAEPGTREVLAWCDRAVEIGLSAIALPEIVSAFCRLKREAKITPTQYQQLKNELIGDVEDVAICDLAPNVLAGSIRALEASSLRSMDAIHIASALALECDLFVSADQRQCEAAALAGLNVERV
jgi:uncharacterized protein